jgi:hypothetical protein
MATALALLPLVARRLGCRPALVHGLWLLVLLKLITPPLVAAPLPWPAPTPEPVATVAPVEISRSGAAPADARAAVVAPPLALAPKPPAGDARFAQSGPRPNNPAVSVAPTVSKTESSHSESVGPAQTLLPLAGPGSATDRKAEVYTLKEPGQRPRPQNHPGIAETAGTSDDGCWP